jgi:hypothetical protein
MNTKEANLKKVNEHLIFPRDHSVRKKASLFISSLRFFPGNPLTALETIDEDEQQEFQYDLIEDDTGLFSIVNGSLVSSMKFDFEKDDGKEFQIKVKSVDNGTPVYSVSFI